MSNKKSLPIDVDLLLTSILCVAFVLAGSWTSNTSNNFSNGITDTGTSRAPVATNDTSKQKPKPVYWAVWNVKFKNEKLASKHMADTAAWAASMRKYITKYNAEKKTAFDPRIEWISKTPTTLKMQIRLPWATRQSSQFPFALSDSTRPYPVPPPPPPPPTKSADYSVDVSYNHWSPNAH